jgi:hypothetical protein
MLDAVLRCLVVALVLCSALARPARAQVLSEPPPPPFPDPKKFARGLFVSGELGALVFLGKAGRFAGPGPIFGVRVGYDLARWLALEARVVGSSSDATLPPPTIGQSVQTYLQTAEVRLSLQLRRVGLFAEGGAGVAEVSSNILDAVGITEEHRASLAVIAGLGVDYHTLNRHFSVGVGADYLWLANFAKSSALTVDVYLRYTR